MPKTDRIQIHSAKLFITDAHPFVVPFQTAEDSFVGSAINKDLHIQKSPNAIDGKDQDSFDNDKLESGIR